MKMPIRKTLFVLIGAAGCAWVLAACGQQPGVPVPDGWKQVEVRQGLFNRDHPLAEINFRASMPGAWEAFDYWTPDSSLVGGIRGMSRNGNLTYAVVEQEPAPSRPGEDDERYMRWTETIEGVEVVLWRTRSTGPEPDSAFGLAGGYLERIPGAPEGLPASLAFRGNGFTESNMASVHDLIRSVRFAPSPDPPEAPEIAITPSPDWRRLEVTLPRDPDRVVLEFMAPPGWVAESSLGLDSLPGEISNGSITIGFDMGGAYSCLDEPGEHLWVGGGFAELEFWAEEIEGRKFYLYRPVDGSRDDQGRTGRTGACIPHLPVVDHPDYQYGPGIGIAAHAESDDDQELVLAILRTIRAVQ